MTVWKRYLEQKEVLREQFGDEPDASNPEVLKAIARIAIPDREIRVDITDGNATIFTINNGVETPLLTVTGVEEEGAPQ